MFCDHGKWFGWKCIKGLKDPLKGFLWLVMFWIWILAGSVFLIVLVSEVCSNMVFVVNERCFSLRIMIWHFTNYDLKKNGKNFLQGLAEPSDNTGGTLFWDPPGPLGQFWNSQKLHWRNPILGSAWSARAVKVDNTRFLPARRFSKFSKSLGNENILYDWLGNAQIRHIDIHLLGLWPGANNFHIT